MLFHSLACLRFDKTFKSADRYVSVNDSAVLDWKLILDRPTDSNIVIDNLTIIPEVRVDLFSDEVDFDADGTGNSSSLSLILAAYYSF